jgi:hypothetical protein
LKAPGNLVRLGNFGVRLGAKLGVKKMNGTATRFLRPAASLAGLVSLGLVILGLATLGWVPTGQAASPAHRRVSLPTDWSHRHLIFTTPSSPEQLVRVSQDPRYQQQIYRRQQRLALPSGTANSESALGDGVTQPVGLSRYRLRLASKKIKRDWSENLGSGASAGAGVYPAKYSFDIHTAFCGGAAQPDYVVYTTGLTGAVNQASIVAYDNIYNGCGGPTPVDYWAYNTGGQILTSPVLSLDGAQVGFVQTTAGAATLVLLKWASGTGAGTVTLPAVPATALPIDYLACTAPCMTLVPLQNRSGLPVNDTTSSVYYDYSSDAAWVGGASGWLHKITGVFKGVPTEVTTGGYPSQMPGGATLSSPVYDNISRNVFVADYAGFLYRVDPTSGGVTASGQLDFGVGFVDGPIVDSSNRFVYVFASEDQNAGCAGGLNCAAVYQLGTSFATGSIGTENEVGAGETVLFGLPNPLYAGAFDSAYYGSSNATGDLYVCGDTGANAILYQVPIVAGAMPSQGQIVSPLAGTGSNAPCSGVTDILNPNALALPAEHLFVSVQNNGIPTNCSSGGCVFEFVDTPWQPFSAYAVGDQVLSSKQLVETVITAGTSAGAAPNWQTGPALLDTDGNPGTQVVWISQGSYGSGFVDWLPTNHYSMSKIRILDTRGNVEVLTTNPAGATTGTGEPAWNAMFGGTTADNTVIWTNVGPLATASLAAAGGSSGIIIDNTLGPFDTTGDSQIYFTTLSDQTCGAGGTGGCAVQASQPGLN